MNWPGRESVPLRWTNWAGNQTAAVEKHHQPTTEAELSDVVGVAAARSKRIKVVGSGHSFTGIGRPDVELIDLTKYRSVTNVDVESREVTVQAGMTVRELNANLDALGLALPNLGDIDQQTISGAISTGTHGTGAKKQTIAASVVGLRLVAGDGGITIADAEENPDLLSVAKIGLGALGVVSEVTVACVPAFSLAAVEAPAEIGDVLNNFDELADGADHFEFFWFPHTNVAATKSNTKVALQSDTRRTYQRVIDETFAQNGAFGLATRLGTMRPSLVPRLAKAITKGLAGSSYIAPSHEVFTSPRLVRFTEMEYSIPRAKLVEAFNEVRGVIDDLPHPVSFPIEVRVLGQDNIALSPAYGRDSAYIAVHLPTRERYETYFAAVEAVMIQNSGRPHWGKLHTRTAADLAPLYPAWTSFQQARDVVDPNRSFANAELDRIIGS